MHRHLISESEVAKIEKQGCCLGKYRVLLDGAFYCFLEGIFDCDHQNRKFVRKINTDMLACKTNRQHPCEECELYKKPKINQETYEYCSQ